MEIRGRKGNTLAFFSPPVTRRNITRGKIARGKITRGNNTRGPFSLYLYVK